MTLRYRLGAWWSPGPLRPQGNPLARWWRLRCVGWARQRRKAFARGELHDAFAVAHGLMTVAAVTTLARRRGTAGVIAAMGESFASTLRVVMADPCLSCGHERREHSGVLLGQPCLDCPCPGFMLRPPEGGP